MKDNATIQLGPVNTNRISIDGGHFFSGQGALNVVYLPYTSESATPSWGKWPRPDGLAPQCAHTALRIAYLEQPNRALRARSGLIGGATLGIRLVLTGPSLYQSGCGLEKLSSDMF